MSFRNDSMTWSVATPTWVAPSSSSVSTEPTTPLVAATSWSSRFTCCGRAKKYRNSSYVPSIRWTFTDSQVSQLSAPKRKEHLSEATQGQPRQCSVRGGEDRQVKDRQAKGGPRCIEATGHR